MATESKNQAQEEQPKARPCPKDCTKCGFQQHAFCAAQMGFYTIEKLHEMQNQISALQQEVEKLKTSEQPLELSNPIENINK